MRSGVNKVNNRGVSILEVAIGLAILAISMAGAAKLFVVQQRQKQSLQSNNAIGELEHQVRSAVFARANSFLTAINANGVCRETPAVTGTLNARLAVPIQGGIGTALLNASTEAVVQQNWTNLAHASTTVVRNVTTANDSFSGKQLYALNRCKANTTDTSVDFSGKNGLYFCLALAPVAGAPKPGQSDPLSMQPLFAEFRFAYLDVTTNLPITCNDLITTYKQPQNYKKLIGMLYYSFYWTKDAVPDRIYSDYSGFMALGL